MAENRNEELLEAILNAGTAAGIVPQSRMEKIWCFALGATIELDIPQSRLETLAIQVAELVRNGGGSEPTGTINITTNGEHNVKQYATAYVSVPQDHTVEDGLIDATLSGSYINNRITDLPPYSLTSRSAITSFDFSLVETVGNYAFSTCSSAETISLPSAASIGQYAFRNCSALTVFNLYSPDRSEIPSLSNSNAFSGTPIASNNGYIVINDDLVDTLKAASNWTAYASQIIGHSDAVQQGIISA